MWWHRALEWYLVRTAASARLVLLWLVCAAAPAHARAPCSEGLSIAWRFHASAPITAALATGSQAAVVASYDSYIHALTPHGRFLWSYTLDAPALGVQVDERGYVYAVSERGFLHVLRGSGAHAWGARLPSPMLPTGPAALSTSREILYVPSAFNLYAFSSKSGLLWRAFIGSPIRSGPVLDPSGRAWIITRDRDVYAIETPHKRVTFALSERLTDDNETTQAGPKLLSVGKQRVVVLDWDGLAAYSMAGEQVWKRPDVQTSTADGSVAHIDGAWHWLDPRTGLSQREHAIDVAVSAQPELVGEWLYVPTEGGRLYALSSAGEVQWCDVASAPLLRPVLQSDSGLMVVAAGDGSVAAVRQRTAEP